MFSSRSRRRWIRSAADASSRRPIGNRYDFYSADYERGEDVTVHSMSHQINGCYNRIGEHLTGTSGSVWPGGKPTAAGRTPAKRAGEVNPYVQEHGDLMAAVHNGTPLNEARALAEATPTAIIGRISA